MENVVREDKRQKLNREITGVIHKDRIWEQWYDQKYLITLYLKCLKKIICSNVLVMI